MDVVVLLHEYQSEIQEYSLDDLHGLEYEKMMLRASYPFAELDRDLELPNTRLFLFAGPNGYGKHTLAEAYANELSQFGYEFFKVDGELLIEDGNAVEVLRELFAKLLQITTPDLGRDIEVVEHRKCFVLFDHLDVLCADSKACSLLTKMFALLDSDDLDYCLNHLAIAGITTNLCDIPELVRMSMNVFELELPDQEQRMEYFIEMLTVEIEDVENDTTHSIIPVEAGVPEVYLAELTQGFTYAELKRFVFLIKMCYKQSMNSLHKGHFRRVVKDVRISKNFVKQDFVEMIIDRMKREKKAAERKVNTQSAGQAPQVIVVGGQGNQQGPTYQMPGMTAGYYPNAMGIPGNVSGQEPKSDFNEDVVNLNRFAWLRAKEKNNTPDLTTESFEELDA